MRFTPWLCAGALALGMTAAASAGPRSMGGGSGQGGMTTGSTGAGASEYAPGQIKKQRRTMSQSARKFAPGQNTSGRYNTPPGQRAR
jgi:hypothetical protein